jgi:hypothetical protein
MDKNGARGRACSIVQFMLKDDMKHGVIDTVLAGSPPDEQALVKQEIQNIANEHAKQAKFHKAIELGVSLDTKDINTAGDEVCMYIGDGDEGDIHSVTLRTHGMSINLEVPTPEDARKLYEVLLKVKEVEAD